MVMEQISFDSEKIKINIGCPIISFPIIYYNKYEKLAFGMSLFGQLKEKI